MVDNFYYDRDSNPITLEEWSELRGIGSYASVALDEVNGLTVSTIWLGLNHNWRGTPPHIFETMVFGPDRTKLATRYATLADAEAGHQATVARLRAET